MTKAIPPIDAGCRMCKKAAGEWCTNPKGQRTPFHAVRVSDARHGGIPQRGNRSQRCSNRARGVANPQDVIKKLLGLRPWLTAKELHEQMVSAKLGMRTAGSVHAECSEMYRANKLQAIPAPSSKAFRYALPGTPMPQEEARHAR